MDWKTLLQPTRLCEASDKENVRSPFLRDVDKIAFSSYFRTLQDKTQVYPLSKSSYVRTRLTHSMEVSIVARSLGSLIGQFVINKYNLNDYIYSGLNNYKITSYDFGYIVQAAALAHDIGNPPFGHTGEEAICNFYSDFINKYKVKSPSNYNDTILLNFSKDNQTSASSYSINEAMFTLFDGNAQGFRIITQLSNSKNQIGLNLTYPVLATFCKYPNSQQNKKYVGSKKVGIFNSELGIFNKIKNTLQITHHQPNIVARYPLTYVLEAADDICYLTTDLCDAFFINIIDFYEIKDLFYNLLFSKEVETFFKNTSYLQEQYLRNLKKDLIRDINDYGNLQDTFDKYNIGPNILESLASEVINILIFIATESFKLNEENILNGSFNNTLLGTTSINKYIKKIRDIANTKIYCSKEKVIKEIKGTTVITQVLEEFTNIVINTYKDTLTKKDTLLNNFYLQGMIKKDNTLQSNLQIVNDFIVKCTDKNILDVYNTLKNS